MNDREPADVPPMGDLDVPEPPPRYELPDQHAEVRPGLKAPAHDHPAAFPTTSSVAERINAARHLRRTVRDWRYDPSWPPLHDALEADYAALLDQDTGSAEWLKGQIRPLLGLHSEPTDTARLDALLDFINRGQTAQRWDRGTIDRLMEQTR